MNDDYSTSKTDSQEEPSRSSNTNLTNDRHSLNQLTSSASQSKSNYHASSDLSMLQERQLEKELSAELDEHD